VSSESLEPRAAVLELTDANFPERVTRAPGIVLVDVWAAWCTPCKALTPVLEGVALRHPDTVRVLALDADANPATVERLGVRALPTVLLFRDGIERRRLVGAQGASVYEEAIREAVQGGALPSPPRVDAAEGAGRDAGPLREAEGLLATETPLLLFKHSRTCPISHTAHAQLEAFRRAHPDAAVRVVVVQEERPLSQAIAAATGVRHESPQALLLHRGAVRWHASHGGITAARLAMAWG